MKTTTFTNSALNLTTYVYEGSSSTGASTVKEKPAVVIPDLPQPEISKTAMDFINFCADAEDNPRKGEPLYHMLPQITKKLHRTNKSGRKVYRVTHNDPCNNGGSGSIGYESDVRLRYCNNPACEGNNEFQEERMAFMRDLLNRLGFEQDPESYIVWPNFGDEDVKNALKEKVDGSTKRMWAAVKYMSQLKKEFYHLSHLKYRGFDAHEVASDEQPAGSASIVCPFCGSEDHRMAWTGRRMKPTYAWQVRREVEAEYINDGIMTDDVLLRSCTVNLKDHKDQLAEVYVEAISVGCSIYSDGDEAVLNAMWELEMEEDRLELAGPRVNHLRYNTEMHNKRKATKLTRQGWENFLARREAEKEAEEQALSIADELALIGIEE